MDFLVFTYIGIAVGTLHMMLPGPHHVGFASSWVVGVTGAWIGGLFVPSLRSGGMAATSYGLPGLLGSILGAIGCIALLELWAVAYLRKEARS